MPSDSPLDQNLPRNKPRWEWIISIGFHVLLLVGALFVVPFDRIIERLTNPTPPAIAEQRVRELADFIERSHEETVRVEVQRMDEILEELRELRDEELDDVRPQEEQLVASAPERALDAQKRAKEALDRAGDENAPVGERVKAHAEAADAQDEAADALEAAGEAFADATAEQAKAKDVSTSAQASSVADRATQQEVKDAERRVENEIERANEAADRLEKKKADAEGFVSRAKAGAESAERAQAISEAAKKALADAGSDPKRQDAARKAAAAAEKQAERSAATAKRLQNESEKKQADLDKATAIAAGTKARADEARKNLEDLKARLQQHQADAKQQTVDARQAQQRAIEKLEKAIAEGAKPDTTQVARADETPVEVRTESLPASVKSATDLEQSISDAFRRMRAARQAQIRGVTIAEAEKSVQVVKPDRAAIDLAKLGADPRTSEQLEDFKKAVLEAESEVKSMRELAETLLTDAINARAAAESGAMVSTGASDTGRADGGAPGSGSSGTAAAQRAAAMQAAGLEEEGGRAKDLTDIMTGKGAVAHIVKEGAHPTVPEKVYALPIGTRHFGTAGRGAGWVYVDSWYIIGPWDNAGRRNTATQFPPEQVIDLDGRYPGKGGRTLSWKFHQEAFPRLRPWDDEAYSIFYLYTELNFDAPAELWCAVGSDDNSNVWVNGFPIWVHAGPERSWAPAHGYRKVRFKEGVNKILFRLENGHHGSNWSFLIHLPESANPPSLPSK